MHPRGNASLGLKRLYSQFGQLRFSFASIATTHVLCAFSYLSQGPSAASQPLAASPSTRSIVPFPCPPPSFSRDAAPIAALPRRGWPPSASPPLSPPPSPSPSPAPSSCLSLSASSQCVPAPAASAFSNLVCGACSAGRRRRPSARGFGAAALHHLHRRPRLRRRLRRCHLFRRCLSACPERHSQPGAFAAWARQKAWRQQQGRREQRGSGSGIGGIGSGSAGGGIGVGCADKGGAACLLLCAWLVCACVRVPHLHHRHRA